MPDAAALGHLQEAFGFVASIHGLSTDDTDALVRTASPMLEAILVRLTQPDAPRPLFVGLCGAQGSGKSTISGGLARTLRAMGRSAVTLSLDDFYLSRAERIQLATNVHPLLRTRGVPGTHDVPRAMALFDSLELADPDTHTRLPQFDKARDDRTPPEREPEFIGRPNVVLFEGWCVGARPQPESALVAPINILEKQSDPDGVWRRHVNNCLAGPYQALFDRLHLLLMLKAPSFEQVYSWRAEQEDRLIAALRASGKPLEETAVMDAPALERFVMHYERLTRHILDEMPSRADLVIPLDENRRPLIG